MWSNYAVHLLVFIILALAGNFHLIFNEVGILGKLGLLLELIFFMFQYKIKITNENFFIF